MAFISALSFALKENNLIATENLKANNEKEHFEGMWIGKRLTFNFILRKVISKGTWKSSTYNRERRKE